MELGAAHNRLACASAMQGRTVRDEMQGILSGVATNFTHSIPHYNIGPSCRSESSSVFLEAITPNKQPDTKIIYPSKPHNTRVAVTKPWV